MPRFDELSPSELREVSAKGGKKKDPRKGFGSLSKKERSEVSKRAAQARWDKYKLSKEAQNGKTDHSSENQPE